MKKLRGDQSRVVRLSVRLYERLLWLYPKRFRQEYGQPMAQLFRDQCRDAFQARAAYGLAKLWVRVFVDLGVTSCREHFAEVRNFMSTTAMKSFLGCPHVTFTKVFVATFMPLAAILVMSVVFWMPRSYSSTARIAVAERLPGGFDPHFIQTEFGRLQSQAVLVPVIEELNLTKWLARQQGKPDPFTKEEACELLKDIVVLQQARNTS